ncbi:hypothetical protein M2212_003085 [Bradyrhizobium elkanii]|uniref:hypothetical protein n=1 Tax=Bradyrhizobium elkanii TaxID=29448 RepID=UPI002166CB10|nr:hypothetical protein [Bradyrhizobium elkanii]MCS3476239.1 hypothetical protein [Bradyrhizobium elkanii]MCS3686690.1 hypothetical protein [Bradyrhizobium elkanii]
MGLEMQLRAGRRQSAKGFWPRRSPDVGSVIGYSYRKLGNSKFSEGWYELGLKTVLTYQYCGRSSRATAIRRKKMQNGRYRRRTFLFL